MLQSQGRGVSVKGGSIFQGRFRTLEDTMQHCKEIFDLKQDINRISCNILRDLM